MIMHLATPSIIKLLATPEASSIGMGGALT
jgi:hypothetical protein